MGFYKQTILALLCLLWMVTFAAGFHLVPNVRRGRNSTKIIRLSFNVERWDVKLFPLFAYNWSLFFSVSVDRRQIPSGSTQLRSISGQTPRARGYDNTQRTLQTSTRQWNSRRIPANVRSNYGRALISKLPPLRRTVQNPVVRSKISKPSNRVRSSRTGNEAATKKPVKDRDYTFHVVLLADVLCRICDNLQGEWRNNCREQRCSRASTDNSWNLELTGTEPLNQRVVSAVGFVVCFGDVTISSYEELTGAFCWEVEEFVHVTRNGIL